MPHVGLSSSRAAVAALNETFDDGYASTDSDNLPESIIVRSTRTRNIVPPRRADEPITFAIPSATIEAIESQTPLDQEGDTSLSVAGSPVHAVEGRQHNHSSSPMSDLNVNRLPTRTSNVPHEDDLDTLPTLEPDTTQRREDVELVDIQEIFPSDPAAEDVYRLRQLLSLPVLPAEDSTDSQEGTAIPNFPISEIQIESSQAIGSTTFVGGQADNAVLAELRRRGVSPVIMRRMSPPPEIYPPIHNLTVGPNIATSSSPPGDLAAVPTIVSSTHSADYGPHSANTGARYLRRRFGDLHTRVSGFQRPPFGLGLQQFVAADAILVIRKELHITSTALTSAAVVNDDFSDNQDVVVCFDEVLSYFGETASPYERAQGHINNLDKLWGVIRMHPERLTPFEIEEDLPLIIALVGNGTDRRVLPEGGEVLTPRSDIRYSTATQILAKRNAAQLDDGTVRLLPFSYEEIFIHMVRRVYIRVKREYPSLRL
ncbi:hypothetical protein CPB83DRAFT_856703 [Crepidotus variabilis]|uniref:Uncharacterized protein n=1 Tax=Crepidotus variabilis TaxID=179855 RepID=A0A9P6EDK0_9AGAR|nr:hypothetical protein CPB83DRAFT_856703 [Crepidotus variabilis]